jgi:hypothetical protein
VLVLVVVQVVADIILQMLVEQGLQAQFKEIMAERVYIMNSAAAEVEQVQLATLVAAVQVALVALVLQYL